jgi:hypothetical protein
MILLLAPDEQREGNWEIEALQGLGPLPKMLPWASNSVHMTLTSMEGFHQQQKESMRGRSLAPKIFRQRVFVLRAFLRLLPLLAGGLAPLLLLQKLLQMAVHRADG